MAAALLEWTPLPSSTGRCIVEVFDPAVSFEAERGWQWAGNADRWMLAPEYGSYYHSIAFYRYGGAVVPAYCVDPPATIPMPAAADIVEWLGAYDGLEVVAISRSAGPDPAWQLDLAASVESCSGDKEKSGLASLWTIDGQPIELPESLGEDEEMRVYLVEHASEILVMAVRTIPNDEGMPEIPDAAEFLARADRLFATLRVE